jgi:hypothetical protein
MAYKHSVLALTELCLGQMIAAEAVDDDKLQALREWRIGRLCIPFEVLIGPEGRAILQALTTHVDVCFVDKDLRSSVYCIFGYSMLFAPSSEVLYTAPTYPLDIIFQKHPSQQMCHIQLQRRIRTIGGE